MQYFTFILIILTYFTGFSSQLSAQNIPHLPQPVQYVNDYVGLMSNLEREFLEDKLRNYDESTSTQIVIVTLESLEGYSIKRYSRKWAKEWGIGRKGKDNGLLIFIPQKERKVRIEVGYGLEAYIPDITAGRIIDELITPRFRQNKFYEGLNEATNLIIDYLQGTFQADDPYTNELQKPFSFSQYSNEEQVGIIALIIFGSIFFIVIISAIIKSQIGSSTYSSGRSHHSSGSSGSYHNYSDFSHSYSDFSHSYSDSSSHSYSDSSFGGGDFGGGGADGSW